jgi:hypothetical protein
MDDQDDVLHTNFLVFIHCYLIKDIPFAKRKPIHDVGQK